MAYNLCVTYGTATPAQAVLGYQPRDYFLPEGETRASVMGAISTDPDSFETHLRLRMKAKEEIMRALATDRVNRANNTRQQRHDPLDFAKLIPGTTKLDVW